MNGSLIDANFLGSSTEVIGHFEGKRLMFIGDSVHRSEFQSMVCVLQSTIPEGKKSFLEGNKSFRRIPPRKIFKAEAPENTMDPSSFTGQPLPPSPFRIMQHSINYKIDKDQIKR
ncbi:hypothetical protein CUMW_181730 [Citrus unshiu]|uniref:Trichome birefringence-like C-terminal domain-containing protein n=1 Tax=Citrus unshiu TaxID=55188 RepID=A0A2H5PZG1_CITUN|nr:hypothetical protein CUMW_181730 [Citrus unshiu]